jgi:hypothetical protein
MKNDGAKTATTHSIASKRGTTTSRLASSTAFATGLPSPKCVWMFSTAMIDSSTRMPMARVRSSSVIRLIDWPAAHSATVAESNAIGIVSTTTTALLKTAERQQNDQSGQQRAQDALGGQRFNRVQNVERLVELEADVDVLGMAARNAGANPSPAARPRA